MHPLVLCLRRHWPAILAIAFLGVRASRVGFYEDPAASIFLGLATLGMTMNLTVILVNGGMPARVTADDISPEEKPHYHPLAPSTRLAFLADWIPFGNYLISPGDILIVIAVLSLFAWRFVFSA